MKSYQQRVEQIAYSDFLYWCEMGVLDEVERALKIGGLCDQDLFNGFVTAAENGHLPLVNCFLEIKSMQNMAKEDLTAFREAAIGGHLHVINRLLGVEGVADRVNEYGNQILMCAVQAEQYDVASRLLQISSVVTSLKDDEDFVAEHRAFFDKVTSNRTNRSASIELNLFHTPREVESSANVQTPSNHKERDSDNIEVSRQRKRGNSLS